MIKIANYPPKSVVLSSVGYAHVTKKKKKKSLIEYKQKGGFRKILHLQAMYGNDPYSFCPLHWWEFNQMAPPTCKEGWEM